MNVELIVIVVITITQPTVVESMFTVSGVKNIPDSRAGNLTPPLIIMLAPFSRRLTNATASVKHKAEAVQSHGFV